MPMNEEILVNVTPQETRVAVLAAGQVQELLVEREANRGLVGNIYVGRVARVLPGMQTAFIEIGLERAAFLHVADLQEHRKSHENGRAEPGKPIEKMLAEGQPLIVQVQVIIDKQLADIRPCDHRIAFPHKISACFRAIDADAFVARCLCFEKEPKRPPM